MHFRIALTGPWIATICSSIIGYYEEHFCFPVFRISDILTSTTKNRPDSSSQRVTIIQRMTAGSTACTFVSFCCFASIKNDVISSFLLVLHVLKYLISLEAFISYALHTASLTSIPTSVITWCKKMLSSVRKGQSFNMSSTECPAFISFLCKAYVVSMSVLTSAQSIVLGEIPQSSWSFSLAVNASSSCFGSRV